MTVHANSPIEMSGKNIDEDIKKLSELKNCNWQQILRAIAPHAPSLESVWILGSNGTYDCASIDPAVTTQSGEQQTKGGSWAFRIHAARFVRPYLKADTKICVCGSKQNNLRFQDYQAVENAILAIVQQIKRTFPHVTESSIVVDSTGGQKLMSIVGAAITFRRQARFQYVDTATPHSVYLYDVAIETKPETGL